VDQWKDITPPARNEFICWVENTKQELTCQGGGLPMGLPAESGVLDMQAYQVGQEVQNNPIWPVVSCPAGLAGLGALTPFRKLLTAESRPVGEEAPARGIASLWFRG
jgi:hypothetical protein